MLQRFICVFVGCLTGMSFIGARYDSVLYENGILIPTGANLDPTLTIPLKVSFCIMTAVLCFILVVIEPKNK